MTEQPTHENLEPIPQPPGKFLLGNLPEVNGSTPILQLMQLARENGPIYQLNFPGDRQVIVVWGFQGKLPSSLLSLGYILSFLYFVKTHIFRVCLHAR